MNKSIASITSEVTVIVENKEIISNEMFNKFKEKISSIRDKRV